VAQGRLTVRAKRTFTTDVTYAVALNDMDPVPLRGHWPLFLTVGQNIRIVKTEPRDPRGPFKVTTIRYLYALSTSDQQVVLSFHWAPEAGEEDQPVGEGGTPITFGHLHVGPALIGSDPPIRPKDLHKAHIPTGRVSLEAVIRLAIEEFGITPRRSDWQTILTTSLA
jgi:hypothetical protein